MLAWSCPLSAAELIQYVTMLPLPFTWIIPRCLITKSFPAHHPIYHHQNPLHGSFKARQAVRDRRQINTTSYRARTQRPSSKKEARLTYVADARHLVLKARRYSSLQTLHASTSTSCTKPVQLHLADLTDCQPHTLSLPSKPLIPLLPLLHEQGYHTPIMPAPMDGSHLLRHVCSDLEKCRQLQSWLHASNATIPPHSYKQVRKVTVSSSASHKSPCEGASSPHNSTWSCFSI
jgi:hypothetical protein